MAQSYPTRQGVTPREYEVWELISHGASQKDIARVLRGPEGRPLSPQTIKDYVTMLLRKVGVQSSAELIVVWYGGDLLREVRSEVNATPPPHARPVPLRERATLFPTRGAREASGLTDAERRRRSQPLLY